MKSKKAENQKRKEKEKNTKENSKNKKIEERRKRCSYRDDGDLGLESHGRHIGVLNGPWF